MERKRFCEQSWLGLRALAVIAVMLLTGTTAWADGVKYIDENGVEQTCTTYTVLQGGGETTLPGGWYVAEGEVSYTSQLRFTGDAHLILADGCNLTVGTEANPITGPAIFADACDLTIYGQGGGTEGMLTATSSSNHAVYAFNNSMDARSTSITINGGKVKAIGRSKCISASNNNGTACITVNGGQVEVTSTNSYGIYAYSKSHTATITINGGQLTATGDTDGIYADSELNSAAITINGGQVTATGGTNGIYADGYYSANITINGGQLTATGDTNGIHALNHNGPSYITLGWTKATDFIKASSYKIKGTGSVKTAADKHMKAFIPAATEGDSDKPFAYIAGGHTLTATELTALAGKVLRPASDEDITIKYFDWDDTQKKLVEKNTLTDTDPASADPTNPDPLTANDFVYVLQGGAETTLGGGWYVAEGDVTYTGWLRFNGDAHIILADGCKMTVTYTASAISGAIYSNRASITIYAQSTDEKTMGSLTAISEKVAAIFANMDSYNGYVTINGGIITAKGTDGIHSQHTGNTANGGITINGGKVIASGSNTNNGSGIRADNNSSSGSNPSLIINGGEVIASNSADYLASISADYITITGGKVEANNTRGPGISAYNTITITGGQVEAIGRDNGIYANKGDISITGGQVEASGTNGDGICAFNGNINLGWTNADDYIMASSYKNEYSGSVKIPAGKRFVVYTPGATETDPEKANCIVDGTAGTDFNLNDIAGMTLRPLDGYYVKDQAGLTFSGKTAPDFTISDTPYYTYKTGDEVMLSTDKNYGQDGIFFNTSPDNAIADATAASGSVVTTKTFAMPAQDVTINGLKYYNTGVKYMDWDESTKTLVEKTTNANDKVYILTGGGETTLPGGWYVVNNWNTAADNDGHSIDAAYTGKLRFNGATHLILADGAEMSVDIQGGDRAINLENSDVATLDIYGQAQGSGALTAKSASYNAIRIYSSGSDGTASLTINGGQVTATGDINGIYVIANRNGTASVTVNGGEVAAGGDYAIVAESNIGNAYVTINGGEVDATGGFNGIYAIANGNGTASITLGWTNATDYIYASSYKAEIGSSGTASVKIPAGKALACTIGEYTTVMGSTDATDYIFGAAGNTTLEYIAGQTLRPAKTLPVAGSASYVALYQDQGDWQVTDPDTKIYVPTGNIIKNGNAYEMELQEVTGGGIPDGKPVIVGKEGGLNGIPVRGTSADEANTIETNYTAANPSPAFFVGDGTKTLNELIIAALGDGTDPTDYIAFTLIGDKLVALDNSGAAVKAGVCIFVISKLYVLQMVQGTYAPPAGARLRGIPFDLGGDATGIESVANVQSSMFNGQWFDLQGRRLDQAPKAKGVYIRNGIQVVVK